MRFFPRQLSALRHRRLEGCPDRLLRRGSHNGRTLIALPDRGDASMMSEPVAEPRDTERLRSCTAPDIVEASSARYCAASDPTSSDHVKARGDSIRPGANLAAARFPKRDAGLERCNSFGGFALPGSVPGHMTGRQERPLHGQAALPTIALRQGRACPFRVRRTPSPIPLRASVHRRILAAR